MAIYHSVTELIGHTPLVELTGYEKKHNVPAELVAKVELFNPAGSIKDRIAAAMLEDAEEKGILNKDTVIIEPTSGNTGVALAAFSAARGYRIIITMPETMSVERRRLMAAYGAELVLTPGPKMVDAIAKAEELAKEIPNSFIPGQFTNPANPKKHYNTTGPEIWNDAEGKVDIFVAGIGTGGTLSGAGKYLKEQNPDIQIIGIEPTDSPVLTQGHPGVHKIQGIGAGFVPDTLDTSTPYSSGIDSRSACVRRTMPTSKVIPNIKKAYTIFHASFCDLWHVTISGQTLQGSVRRFFARIFYDEGV